MIATIKRRLIIPLQQVVPSLQALPKSLAPPVGSSAVAEADYQRIDDHDAPRQFEVIE